MPRTGPALLVFNHVSDKEDEDYEPAEPYQQYVPVWVVTDLAASGLRRRGGGSSNTAADTGGERESEEEAEARRQERRRVIANNEAWASAETVRREWLAGSWPARPPRRAPRP